MFTSSFAESMASSVVRSPGGRLGVRGSFVSAVICRDGVVMASDSRAVVFSRGDKARTPIAYFDTQQKIFPIGLNAIGETGQGSILNIFVSALIGDFMRRVPASVNLDVDQLLPAFLKYSESRLPPEALAEVREQTLFSAGRIGTSPAICYFREGEPRSTFACVKDSGLIQSAPTLLSGREEALAAQPCQRVASGSRACHQGVRGGWRPMEDDWWPDQHSANHWYHPPAVASESAASTTVAICRRIRGGVPARQGTAQAHPPRDTAPT
jgi:hypothetical protein